MHDIRALDRKHHYDREKKKDKGERTDHRNKTLAIPGLAHPRGKDFPGGETRDEWHAQIDADALRDLADRDLNDSAAESEPSGNNCHEYICIEREEQHLEDRIERNQSGTIFRVAAGEVVPHDYHRDTSRKPDDDQAGH